ncbi:MAG: DMT family transporter [Bauldia sp.]|nr:DMT family transporter [Bauldia sp.]
MPTHHSHRQNLAGIAAMCVAMIGFVSNDTQVKLASEHIPLGEVMFLRGLVTVALVGALVVAGGHAREWHAVRRPAVLLRTLGEVAASILFLTALTHIDLSHGTTLMQAVPLVVTAASAIFFREWVSWRRWTAIVIGFIGVVVVMRPGFVAIDTWSIMVLAAVLFVALRDLSTRSIPGSVPTVIIVGIACVGVTLAGGVMGLTVDEPWHMPDLSVLPLLFGSAVCLIIGYWFVIFAMRTGDAGASAPFRYTVIVWATLYGFLIWGDRPDLWTGIGTVLIVAPSLYVFYRERRLAREDPANRRE